MTYLTLKDFVCSDFDSFAGSRDYPARDCVDADRAWSASPSSTTAPCCGNSTLVMASVAMMTEALAYGITELPLQTLLSGGTDPSYSSTDYFVKYYLHHYSFLFQLIVSRNQRMAGVSYYARKTNKHDAPTRVEVVPGYWSFNYQSTRLETVLWGLMLIGAGFTVAHDRRNLVEHFCGNAALLRQEDSMRYRHRRTCLAEFVHFSARWSAYVVAFEIPSIVLPLLFELLMPFLQARATPAR